MSRTTLVYILTILASAAGLWAVLKSGSALAAPPDLSGSWQVQPGAGGPDEADAPFGREMRIEQSGRYLHVEFSGGLALDLKASEFDRRVPGQPSTLRATDGTWTIAFQPQKGQRPAGAPLGPAVAGGAPATELWVLVEKPRAYSFIARRAGDSRLACSRPRMQPYRPS